MCKDLGSIPRKKKKKNCLKVCRSKGTELFLNSTLGSFQVLLFLFIILRQNLGPLEEQLVLLSTKHLSRPSKPPYNKY